MDTVILVLKTWAVWGRDFKLGIGLLAFYLGMSIAIYANMGIFLRAIQCEYKGTYYMYNTQ
jgi:hypothetical protein